jgi:hypothetical protein
MPTASKKSKLAPFRYPTTVLDDYSDYLSMSIRTYKPNNKFQNESTALKLFGQGLSNQVGKTKANIILPVPTSITASNGVTWNGATMNAIEDIAMRAGPQLMEGNYKGAGQTVTDGLRGIGASDDVIRAAQAGFTAKILQAFGSNVTFGQALARTTGQVLNPNLELLFNGPGLRSFSFAYQLTPRDANEANQIKFILRILKKSMSPKRSPSSSAFLCSPDIFHLNFKKGSGEHPYLNRFKPMAMTNCSVNYTGTGTYATYDDGSPVVYTLSMTFQELSPVYDQDYDTDQGLIGAGF